MICAKAGQYSRTCMKSEPPAINSSLRISDFGKIVSLEEIMKTGEGKDRVR